MSNKTIIPLVLDGCEMISANSYPARAREIIVNNRSVLMKSFRARFFTECFPRSLKLYKLVSLVNKNGEAIDYPVKSFWRPGLSRSNKNTRK